jgi:hypothetical protein
VSHPLCILLLRLYYDADRSRMSRHLSLAVYDEKYPQRSDHTNPLLKPESLRRLAWSVYYLEMVHNDRLASSVDEPRISLPCDETCFLRGLEVKGNDPIPMGSMLDYPDLRHNECPNNTHLGLSAHLLRTAAMRHRIKQYCSGIKSTPTTSQNHILAGLEELEHLASQLIRDLPPHLVHSEDNLYIHSLRRTSFLLLHMLRHSCFLLLYRAQLAVCSRIGTAESAQTVAQYSERCIRHAVAVAWISGDGLQLGVNLDPTVAIIAYEAFEGKHDINLLLSWANIADSTSQRYSSVLTVWGISMNHTAQATIRHT